jgi:hypothetical protein
MLQLEKNSQDIATMHFFVVGAIANPILEGSKSKHARIKICYFPSKHKHD